MAKSAKEIYIECLKKDRKALENVPWGKIPGLPGPDFVGKELEKLDELIEKLEK